MYIIKHGDVLPKALGGSFRLTHILQLQHTLPNKLCCLKFRRNLRTGILPTKKIDYENQTLIRTIGTYLTVFLKQAQKVIEFTVFPIYYRHMMFDQYSFRKLLRYEFRNRKNYFEVRNKISNLGVAES